MSVFLSHAPRTAIKIISTPSPTLIRKLQNTTSDVAERAQEIYETINDILSEMRNNMVLVEQELPPLTASDEKTRVVVDAVEALVDSVETAKGALRGLRDLAEGK